MIGALLPFFFASAAAMELLKFHFRRRTRGRMSQAQEGEPRASVESTATYQTSALAHSSARGATMQTIVIPVAASHNCELAVQHVIRQFMNNTAMEIHLLNVQAPFRRHVSRFVSKRDLASYYREAAQEVFRPYTEQLDKHGIPYSVHVEVGDSASCITRTARRLHCDRIVIGTARKNSLTRLAESSVMNKVIERTSIPVEVIAGDEVSPWERYGIPAAIGVLLAMVFAAAD